MRMWCCRGTRATSCPVAEHHVGVVSRMCPLDALALHDSLNLPLAIRSCPCAPESQNVMHCNSFFAVRDAHFVKLEAKDGHLIIRCLPRAQPHPCCLRSELQHLGLGHVRRALGSSSHWTRHSRTRFNRTLDLMLFRRPTRGVHFARPASHGRHSGGERAHHGGFRAKPRSCTRRAGAGTGRYRCRSGSGAGIRC